jgi:hypothetical protein
MNERIKELAKQSNLQDGWFCGQGNIEKFAQLIVRECVGIADEYDGVGSIIVSRIEKHFGVDK